MPGWEQKLRLAAGLAALGFAAACAAPQDEPGTTRARGGPPASAYLGVTTRRMDSDLVNIQVRMRGGRSGEAAETYARCAAAQYALIRGFGFARHVRTNLMKDGGIWTADAVYTISPGFPAGTVSLNAGDVVAECKRDGIPTV